MGKFWNLRRTMELPQWGASIYKKGMARSQWRAWSRSGRGEPGYHWRLVGAAMAKGRVACGLTQYGGKWKGGDRPDNTERGKGSGGPGGNYGRWGFGTGSHTNVAEAGAVGWHTVGDRMNGGAWYDRKWCVGRPVRKEEKWARPKKNNIVFYLFEVYQNDLNWFDPKMAFPCLKHFKQNMVVNFLN
jgi:hypothetical protein